MCPCACIVCILLARNWGPRKILFLSPATLVAKMVCPHLLWPLAHSNGSTTTIYNLSIACNSEFFDYLTPEERWIPMQLCISWWREENLWYAIAGARLMNPIDSWAPAHHVSTDFRRIMNSEVMTLMLTARPSSSSSRFQRSIHGGWFHDC